jgi:hypothetical protein
MDFDSVPVRNLLASHSVFLLAADRVVLTPSAATVQIAGENFAQ